MMIARHIIRAAEIKGLKVYPNSSTCWSFDDKIAQKYLLESIGAPLVPTYVFFTFKEALDWIATADFPKVFKLRKGAGSLNVKLVNNASEARRVARRSFGRGFKPLGNVVQDQISKRITGTNIAEQFRLIGKLKKAPRILSSVYRKNRSLGVERGYLYFQDFIPNNRFDTRITVLFNCYAFGFTRDVRKNDFRASGIGRLSYDITRINPKCIKIAFDISRILDVQSIAIDFVDDSGEPLITEVSYGFVSSCIYDCSGYWDTGLQWHEEHIWPEDLIISHLLKEVDALRE
jgi:glutathione synthase/RimK-type ligase-like ATP-grasp enzyme